jgi:hypothetical protein
MLHRAVAALPGSRWSRSERGGEAGEECGGGEFDRARHDVPLGSALGMNALTLDAVRPDIVHRGAIAGETPAVLRKSPKKGRPSLFRDASCGMAR